MQGGTPTGPRERERAHTAREGGGRDEAERGGETRADFERRERERERERSSRHTLRYSVYLLFLYKSTNTDAEGAARSK